MAYRAISKDDPEALTRTFEEASFCDIVIFTGGVSMGDADYVPSILKAVGVKEIFHKVKIRPGKPIWFGRKGTQAIFGLPGNPLSVMVGFKIFIEPYLRKAMGMQSQPAFKFPLDNKKIKKVNLDEFFLCKLKTDGQSKLETIKSNGSGDFTSVLLSDGIALHPVEAKDIEEDDLVDFIFWRSIR